MKWEKSSFIEIDHSWEWKSLYTFVFICLPFPPPLRHGTRTAVPEYIAPPFDWPLQRRVCFSVLTGYVWTMFDLFGRKKRGLRITAYTYFVPMWNIRSVHTNGPWFLSRNKPIQTQQNNFLFKVGFCLWNQIAKRFKVICIFSTFVLSVIKHSRFNVAF